MEKALRNISFGEVHDSNSGVVELDVGGAAPSASSTDTVVAAPDGDALLEASVDAGGSLRIIIAGAPKHTSEDPKAPTADAVRAKASPPISTPSTIKPELTTIRKIAKVAPLESPLVDFVGGAADASVA